MKSRRVVWSEAAIEDLERTISYIADDSPAASRKVSVALRSCGRRLGVIDSGRLGRVTGTFEKVVPRLPYIIAYAVRTTDPRREELVILRVIHGARDWPGESWPR